MTMSEGMFQRVGAKSSKRDPPLLPFLPPLTIFLVFMILSSLEIVKPVEHGFFRDDESILHPGQNDTVPYRVVLFVVILVTPVFLVFASRSEGTKRIFKEVFIYYFGFVMAMFLTEVIKLSAGRLRPDFIERCNPDYSKVTHPDEFIMEDICAGGAHDVLQGRKSHPSGHAMSSAFAAAYSMTIWMRLVKRNRIHSGFNTLVLAVLIIYPVFVATSRVADYKHHPLDVLVGGILGCSFALYTAFYLNEWVGQVPIFGVTSGGAELSALDLASEDADSDERFSLHKDECSGGSSYEPPL